MKIHSHIESRPAGIISAFLVRVHFENEKVSYQAGFEDTRLQRKTRFQYPVPLIISEEDEEALRGSLIDYHSGDGFFFVYPDIQLEAHDTPDPKIKKILVNRNVISAENYLKHFAVAKEDFFLAPGFFPHLLHKIFAVEKIESVYLEGNIIQLEFSESPSLELEEKAALLILDYFENNGRPVKLQ